MKAGLKKLRSCSFSRERAPREFFGTRTQYNRRLVCDHPEMKVHWREKTCVDCDSYRNRNQEDAPPAHSPGGPDPADGQAS